MGALLEVPTTESYDDLEADDGEGCQQEQGLEVPFFLFRFDLPLICFDIFMASEKAMCC